VKVAWQHATFLFIQPATGERAMHIRTFNDLYLDFLRDIYNAEKQLTKALPKMTKAATSPELKQAFEMHCTETERQVGRLEAIFGMLGEKPGGVSCEAMEGLIEEAEELIHHGGLMGGGIPGKILDAALIASAQKVEHYEIATYGTLVHFARLLGHNDHLAFLEQTLEEEKASDKKLTQIAAGSVNQTALAA
jgi:ferritin-like metal-binding protein YciE